MEVQLSYPTGMSHASGSSLFSPPPLYPDADDLPAWYGNIQYLLNISAVGAASCVLLFVFVKLRSDHRIPGPSALFVKLLAVYHATASQIALHCGADARQFLGIERSSFIVLASLSVISLVVALPLNLWAGDVPMGDQFTRTTISHIPAGSPLLWFHFFLMFLVVVIAHLGISRMGDYLRNTRFRDGSGNPSDSNFSSIAIFTIMVQGIPKNLAANKLPLEEFFQHRYPGKVYRVIAPFDICSFEDLIAQWNKVQTEICRLESLVGARTIAGIGEDDGASQGSDNTVWRKLKTLWCTMVSMLGYTDDERLRKLHNLKLVLETKLLDYKEGRAPGAGLAFVIFKDVYTTNMAVKDFQAERKKRPIGRFFPLMELQLGRSRWRVEGLRRLLTSTGITWV
ncbi:hypothetical protein HPP92_015018 [Vanilla planifolia]|uniref:CSC1/OSCA1-like N-terminal transmembrane domain-containing protein n=1 Tax=Vanilla planifolia TaxID=51239 RepID=A0A835QLI1_VANPL|nr:hypothetical protein HPP92_015018 [Vanilla planifolia]